MSKKVKKYQATNVLNSTDNVELLGARLIVTKKNTIYFNYTIQTYSRQ